jgi:hypothetical protein
LRMQVLGIDQVFEVNKPSTFNIVLFTGSTCAPTFILLFPQTLR